MKMLWCWRCKMEVPMLDDDEFKKAEELYSFGFRNPKPTIKEKMKPLVDYYADLTGFQVADDEYNSIMHHKVSQYGTPCENCGKPYRTPQASFCAACGHKRI